MTTLFELNQLTVRASADGVALRTRTYTVLDASGATVGDAVQGAGGAVTTAQRVLTRNRLTMPADFAVHDGEGGVALIVAKRRSGLLMPKVRIEAALADGTMVAIAHSMSRAREFEVADPSGALVATLRRWPGALFAIADATGQGAGTVALDANTLSARRAGTAHPHSYTISFAPAAGTLLRIGALAVVLGFDSIRGV